MIDVKKAQKALSGKKIKEQDVNIYNKIMIIASDDVYDLWSEVFSCQSQGKVIDLESLQKFKDLKNWTPDKDGVINQEFFKSLGDLSKA